MEHTDEFTPESFAADAAQASYFSAPNPDAEAQRDMATTVIVGPDLIRNFSVVAEKPALFDSAAVHQQEEAVVDQEAAVAIDFAPIQRDFILDLNTSLGAGVNGHVRIARCKNTGRVFALKIIPDTERARQEVQTQIWLAQLSLRVVQIVRVYSNLHRGKDGLASQHLFIVMERAVTDLFKSVKEQRSLDEQACRIAIGQVTDALWHMHHHGLMHRDLKLENILIDGHGSALLADFGFAGHPVSDRLHFSPAYAAPEIVINRRAQRARLPREVIGPAADMWALGVTLYTMLAGAYPFDVKKLETEREEELILAGRLPMLSAKFKVVSDDCKDVIRGLLCVDASQRMTIDQLAQHPWMTLPL